MREYVEIGGHDVEIEVVPPFSGYAHCPISTCFNAVMPLRADDETEEGAKQSIINKMKEHLRSEHGEKL